jgi:hypothetical protein
MALILTDGPDSVADSAVSFDGSYGMRIATDPADVDTTFAFWFRGSATGTLPSVYMNLGSLTFTYVPATNTFTLTYQGGSVGDTPATDYSTGWHFCVVTFNKATENPEVIWYVDGTAILTQADAVQPDEERAYALAAYDSTNIYTFDFFDFQQWPRMVPIADLDEYQTKVLTDPDSVLPPEEA